MKKNVILSDMPLDEKWEFRKGLEKGTNEKWTILSCVSNKGRRGAYNIVRYLLYFYFPLLVFLDRKKYDKIVSWQSFYGVLFAFYCKIFHVRKKNFLLLKNFTYKPKGNGLLGKLYYKWMRYVVKSQYIDIFVCTSTTFCKYCAEQFDEPLSRFIYLPFGVEDFTKKLTEEELKEKEDYVLSLGRSNRDWNWLIESLANTDINVKIICDQLHRTDLPSNIEILNDVWGLESYRYIAKCKMMVIPIQDGKIGSGETVLLQAMSFSKPIIINRPSCLADDYIEDGVTGIVINKSMKELQDAIHDLYINYNKAEQIGRNARKNYENIHSIYQYGIYISQLIYSK